MGNTVNPATTPAQPAVPPHGPPPVADGTGQDPTQAEILAATTTPLDRLMDEPSPLAAKDTGAALNGAVAGALANQQAGRIASSEPTPAQKAAQGFVAAQGPNPATVPVDDLVRSAADLVHRAPAAEQAHVANVVQRLGVALQEGRLVPGDPLRQVMHTAANSAPGSSAYKGALAHLTRAAEVLERTRLAPGTALAFDPAPPQTMVQEAANRHANATGAGATGAEPAAGLPKLDTTLVDADLYYRQDNRTSLRRAFDAVTPRPDPPRQPLTIESLKSTAHALSEELAAAIKGAGTGTPSQVGRQQAWQAQGNADAPRQVKSSTAAGDGFHNLMEPGALKQLRQLTPDPNARTVTVGERSYSVTELEGIRAANQPQVDAKVQQALDARAAQGKTTSADAKAGITRTNVKAVHGDTPPVALPDGTPVGRANPRLGPLPQPPELPGTRQGGAIGAAGAFVVSGAAALRDGKLTAAEARDIAANTAAGGVLGAVGAKAEQAVTPAIARALAARGASSGAGAALGTTLASRVAGSTVVGAAITAGVSMYQNRDGLAKGDSQAIGRVTADTAVGAVAVAGGAIAGAAATGALAGSVVPGVGTAVGAVVGIGVGVAVTYGAQISGATDWVAGKVADGVDGLKNAASSAWSSLKEVF
ncbi:hypothetical protein [Azohydromonas australica]|uniref:hypothetical protein n=1 Tax=Azohydromonas australica TaxID=364039 RepID=UPI00040CEE75|nr:hypothetical protein [Azohydromonas australica]